jgi:RNA 3'-terminal phosphate cyclase (ATP)
MEVVERGYYPAGGGLVRLKVGPSPPVPVRIGTGGSSGIRSCSSGLPEHVAERQAARAASVLAEVTDSDFPVSIHRTRGTGIGSSCTVWTGAKGSSALGKIGLRAEKVGEMAARSLIEEMEKGGETDPHLADQLLLYLGRHGGAYTTSSLTLHAKTVCWLLEQFGFPVYIAEGPPVEFSV